MQILYEKITRIQFCVRKKYSSTAGRSPKFWAGIAGTSAGATGGILKSTPAVEAIAPKVIEENMIKL